VTPLRRHTSDIHRPGVPEMGARTDNPVCFEFRPARLVRAQRALVCLRMGSHRRGGWTDQKIPIGPDPRLFALWPHAAGKVRRVVLGTVARGAPIALRPRSSPGR